MPSKGVSSRPKQGAPMGGVVVPPRVTYLALTGLARQPRRAQCANVPRQVSPGQLRPLWDGACVTSDHAAEAPRSATNSRHPCSQLLGRGARAGYPVLRQIARAIPHRNTHTLARFAQGPRAARPISAAAGEAEALGMQAMGPEAGSCALTSNRASRQRAARQTLYRRMR